MSNDLIITSLTVIEAPVNKVGNELLAVFNVRVSGIGIVGCVLIRKANGTIVVNGPKGHTHTGKEISATFEDDDLRDEVKDRAVALLEQCTGKLVAAE